MNASQADLDRWLGTSDEDRGVLREGRLPERMRKYLGPGCLSVIALPFGVGLGALAGHFLNEFNVIHDVPMATAIGGGGVVGGILALALVRAWASMPRADDAGLANMSVRSEIVEVTALEKAPRAALLTASGRRYRLLLEPPAELDLRGRLRVFFVDPAERRPDPSGVESEPLVVGLEVA